MQRDILLLTEMIDAAEQAHQLTAGITIGQLETDRQRRDALLWNFTVLGEAAGQLSAEVKDRFPGIPWQQPIRLRNRIVHGTGPSTWKSSTPPLPSNCPRSQPACDMSWAASPTTPECWQRSSHRRDIRPDDVNSPIGLCGNASQAGPGSQSHRAPCRLPK